MQKKLFTEIQNAFPLISVTAINGEVKERERDSILIGNKKLIEEGGQSVLFLSTQAASEGLNCQFYHNMIELDLEWNPGMQQQSRARLIRIGQNKKVHIWTIVTESFFINGNEMIAMDDKIKNVQNEKIPLANIIEVENAAWFFKRMYIPEAGKLLAGSWFGDVFESRPKGSLGGPDSVGSYLLDTFPKK